MDIKPIETYYNGYRFRSRLEARWAVFFDAAGIKYQYEPEGFDVGDGVLYLPDFRLHNIQGRGGPTVWVEVKGQMTAEDARKIKMFVGDGKYGCPINPLLILGDIPRATSEYELINEIMDRGYHSFDGFDIYQFNFKTIDGDYYTAYPAISKGGHFELFCLSYLEDWDDYATLLAYQRARIARFEHGETPPTTPIWR
jgi:hypothetical protein